MNLYIEFSVKSFGTHDAEDVPRDDQELGVFSCHDSC